MVATVVTVAMAVTAATEAKAEKPKIPKTAMPILKRYTKAELMSHALPAKHARATKVPAEQTVSEYASLVSLPV